MSWPEKDYPIICHVCGKRGIHRTQFLDGAAQYCDDGSYRTLKACPEHSSDEIVDAWNAWCNGTLKPFDQ